jgi:hypothetical protein
MKGRSEAHVAVGCLKYGIPQCAVDHHARLVLTFLTAQEMGCLLRAGGLLLIPCRE